MKFTNFVLDRISSNVSKSILLYGDGGIGKTTAFLELYRILLNQSYTIEGRFIVPIYIPLNEFFSSGIKSDGVYIREYICKNYLASQSNLNIISEFDCLLDDESSKYQFFLLCDGLNETADYNILLSEINLLDKYRNVTVCVACRHSVKTFNCFDEIQMVPLTTNQVESIVKTHIDATLLDNNTIDLLKNPFYLKRWISLPDNQKQGIVSKSQLLDQYMEWLEKKQLYYNTAKSYLVGNELNLRIDYTSFLTDSLFFLKGLAWEMENNNSMIINARDLLWKKAMDLYPGEVMDKLQVVKFGCKYFCEILISMGLIKEIEKNRIVFSHQIYRDYFASQYLLDDDFGSLEHKISQHAISDNVMEFYTSSFKSKTEMYLLAHNTNEHISRDYELKNNPIVNKNIIRIFNESSDTLQGEDFSNRNFRLANLNDFVNIMHCNFEKCTFDEDTLWTRDDGWCSIGTGEVFCTKKYLICPDSLQDSIFDIRNGEFIKKIQFEGDVVSNLCSICFEYEDYTYIAHGTIDDRLVILNIEKGCSTYVELENFILTTTIVYCSENSSIYILGHSDENGVLAVYNMNDKSLEIINDIVALGKTQYENTVFYCDIKNNIYIAGKSRGPKTRSIGMMLLEQDYNLLIDYYYINGKKVVVTDRYISYANESCELENVSYIFPEDGLISETCYDCNSNVIFLLTKNGNSEQLLLYDLNTNSFTIVSPRHFSITNRWDSKNRMFIANNKIYIFEDEQLVVGSIVCGQIVDFSLSSLGLFLSDVVQTKNNTLLLMGTTTKGEVKIQCVSVQNHIIYEKRAHLCPEFRSVSTDEQFHYIALLDHNGDPKIAVFDHGLKLKEMRKFPDIITSYYCSTKSKGSIWGTPQLLDEKAEFVALNADKIGKFIFRFDYSQNSYSQFYHLSSGYQLMKFHQLLDLTSSGHNVDPILPAINKSTLITDFYDASIVSYFDKNLIVHGKIKGEEKYFFVDLESAQFAEMNTKAFKELAFFKNTGSILGVNDKNIYLYNAKTNERQELNFSEEAKEKMSRWIKSIEGTGLFVGDCFFWLSTDDDKYFLNIYSSKYIYSVYICPTWRDVVLTFDKEDNAIVVIIQRGVSNDNTTYITTFSSFENGLPSKKVYVIRDEPVGIYKRKMFCKEKVSQYNPSYEYIWYKTSLNNIYEKRYLVPFDKNLDGSNFKDVNLDGVCKRILARYGAIVTRYDKRIKNFNNGGLQ